MEAYESGKIRGRRSQSKRPSAEELLRVYQREADKQRLLARKADFAQARLLFIVEAMKDLLSDESFVTLLRAEGLAPMPRALAARLEGETDK
jgi:ParB family transcriptional regulator, chromosome partitioning protein